MGRVEAGKDTIPEPVVPKKEDYGEIKPPPLKP